MKYVVIIDASEREDAGVPESFDDIKAEVSELLRSGYFEVQEMREVPWPKKKGSQ